MSASHTLGKWEAGFLDSITPVFHDGSGKHVEILEAELEGQLCVHTRVHVCVLHTYYEVT